MKKIKNKKILNLFITSKICTSLPFSQIDQSHLNFLLGYRFSFFSLINPFLFKKALKTSFLSLEFLLKKKKEIIFIADISDKILFNKMLKVCKNKNILLLKEEDISLGFLTNKKNLNSAIVTLFLKPNKIELIQKEAASINMFLVSFDDLQTNKNSSTISVNGNYNLFTIQNLILTLLTICLEKNYESS